MLKSLKTKLGLIDFSIPWFLQGILNLSLIFLALILSVLLANELLHFGWNLLLGKEIEFHEFLEEILVFFLYFEFISMIVKYFKDNYHFPLRYFIYIAITAMVRLIIVDHNSPMDTLIYALVILALIIGYFIINFTPRDRPEGFRYSK